MEPVYNVCNYCSVGCNVTFMVKTPDLYYVSGAPPELGPNHGELCAKGRFGFEHYLDGTRRLRPMVRRDGKLREASWDEAFAAIRQGLAKIIEDHSPDHILVTASPKLTNEELYLAGKYARAAIKTNNIASFHRMVNEADYNALDAMLGATASTVGVREIEEADLFIVLGGNPTSENPVLGWQMKRRIKHGTQAIVINSGQIDLTSYATVWADARRGTATTLLNGVIAELARRDKLNRQFISERTTNAEQVLANLAKNDLGEVASVTGVSTETIQKIVDILSDPTKKIVAYYNVESRIDRSTNDLKALTTLMLALGKIGSEGSGIALVSGQCNNAGARLAGFDNRLLPGGALADHAHLTDAISKMWCTDLRKLFETSGINIGRKIREDKIRAAVIFGENPSVAPEYHHFVINLEFLVVADMYLTETAQGADVFLPLSAYMETVGHLTNWFGLQQKTNPIGEPANGLRTLDILSKLSALAGYTNVDGSFDNIYSELQSLIQAGESRDRKSVV